MGEGLTAEKMKNCWRWKPVLMATVEILERTADKRLRHSAVRRVRVRMRLLNSKWTPKLFVFRCPLAYSSLTTVFLGVFWIGRPDSLN